MKGIIITTRNEQGKCSKGDFSPRRAIYVTAKYISAKYIGEAYRREMRASAARATECSYTKSSGQLYNYATREFCRISSRESVARVVFKSPLYRSLLSRRENKNNGGASTAAMRRFAPGVRTHTRAATTTSRRIQIQFGIELHGRMITDVNNSVIMTSTVAGYANKARRSEIKDGEPVARWREEEEDENEEEKEEMQAGASPVYREIRENKEADCATTPEIRISR